jgi:hypothetical protein
MELPRRRFLQLATGATTVAAMATMARAQEVCWNSLGGGLTSAPAICSWGPGRLDIFARGEDFALWHKHSPDLQNWEWSKWESLGGELTSPPAAVSWGEGRIDVFVRGTDRALWHRWFTHGNWSGWESLAGALNFGPAVSSWGPGRLDVFARGTDNTIFQRTFDGSWRAWTPIGEPWTRVDLPGIAAVSTAPGHIDLFMWVPAEFHPPNVYLAHKSFSQESWRSTTGIGDIFAVPAAPASVSTSLAVASWRFRAVDWFMRGADNTLQHSAGRVDTGPGTSSSLGVIFGPPSGVGISRGGFLTSGPAAVSTFPKNTERRIDVVVRGGDNALWHARLLSESVS